MCGCTGVAFFRTTAFFRGTEHHPLTGIWDKQPSKKHNGIQVMRNFSLHGSNSTVFSLQECWRTAAQAFMRGRRTTTRSSKLCTREEHEESDTMFVACHARWTRGVDHNTFSCPCLPGISRLRKRISYRQLQVEFKGSGRDPLTGIEGMAGVCGSAYFQWSCEQSGSKEATRQPRPG